MERGLYHTVGFIVRVNAAGNYGGLDDPA